MPEKRKHSQSSKTPRSTIIAGMSEIELANLGDGKIAYIKMVTGAEARDAYPGVKGIPPDVELFALHGADGTPLALTDSRQAAMGHALGEDLEITSIH
jgi:hypothetical protein